MSEAEIDLTMPNVVVPMATATPVNTHDGADISVPPISAATVTNSMRLLSTANNAPSGSNNGSSSDQLLGPEQLSSLALQGYPTGLAQELGRTRTAYPVRFWVVDNSGSMRNNDGHQLRGGSSTQAQIRVVPCTRWTELQGAVEYHSSLAGLLGATTIFRMLNDPGPHIGPQEFSIAGNGGAENDIGEKQNAAYLPASTNNTTVDEDVKLAHSVIQKCEPNGVTPLTNHLNDIRSRVQAMEPVLRANGQQVCVVLATDGLPSDRMGQSTPDVQAAFVNALQALQALPVWIVVRLCTDDDSVVEYYNELDAMLELPLEVIDDFLGEAKEVQSANKWLNYALPLHRCREMGYHHRIFDLLDERLLNKDELHEFLTLLFGSDVMATVPDANTDWKGFKKALTTIVQSSGKLYNPTAKKITPWIDMKQLDRCYSKKGFFRW